MHNASLYEINQAIEAKYLKEYLLEKVVPRQYHEFFPLLSKVIAHRLAWCRLVIDTGVGHNEGDTPTWRPLYSLS